MIDLCPNRNYPGELGVFKHLSKITNSRCTFNIPNLVQ